MPDTVHITVRNQGNAIVVGESATDTIRTKIALNYANEAAADAEIKGLTGLALNLDAAAIDSITKDANGKVSEWKSIASLAIWSTLQQQIGAQQPNYHGRSGIYREGVRMNATANIGQGAGNAQCLSGLLPPPHTMVSYDLGYFIVYTPIYKGAYGSFTIPHIGQGSLLHVGNQNGSFDSFAIIIDSPEGRANIPVGRPRFTSNVGGSTWIQPDVTEPSREVPQTFGFVIKSAANGGTYSVVHNGKLYSAGAENRRTDTTFANTHRIVVGVTPNIANLPVSDGPSCIVHQVVAITGQALSIDAVTQCVNALNDKWGCRVGSGRSTPYASGAAFVTNA